MIGTGPSCAWSWVHESCLKRATFNVSFRRSPTSGDHYWPSETSWSQFTGTEEAVKATATLNNKEEENRFVFLNSCPRFSTFSACFDDLELQDKEELMDTVTAPAIWDTSLQLSWQSNLVQKLISSSSGSSLVTEEEIGNSHTIYCSRVIFLQTHGRFSPVLELILWNVLIAEFFLQILQSPFILTTFFWLIGRFNQDRNLSPGLRAPINLRRYHEHTSGAQCACKLCISLAY